MVGRGNKAYASLKKIMPDTQPNYDVYKSEPYVFAEYLIGPKHPYRHGEGAFTWITGTAAWMFLSVTEWIFGVRHELDGLRIDPVVPSHWKNVKMVRPFRGDVYEILIRNPKGVQRGVKSITVDGVEQKGHVVHPRNDGRRHKVKVVMG